MLPFDVTITGANEYGAQCAAKIFGVEILNEGWGSSIDDAVSEQQATFVARACGQLTSSLILHTRSLRPVPNPTLARARARAERLRYFALC